MLKIAIYYNLAYGGAKRAVQEHVKGLRSLDHQVDVYTQDEEDDSLSPGSVADNFYKYPFAVKKLSFPIIARLYEDFQIYYTLKVLHKKIAEDIDAKKYDIVLIHTDTYTQSPYLPRFLKTANVYYCLEPLRMVYEYSLRISDSLSFLNKLYEEGNRYIRKSIDRTNARAARYSLAISFFARAYIIQTYDIYPKISYLGVDTKVFHPMHVKKKNQVLFIAPKDSIFGYDLAEKAVMLIPKEIRPEIKIVFGVNKTIRVSEKDVVKTYNESLVTLSLSKLDTFGLVPLESMACGTPVIATNVAGYRELIIDGKTGFLVEFEPEEIAKKIMKFINEPELSRKMGQAGRIWVEKNWTWKKQIIRLEKLLFEIIQNEKLMA